MAEIKKDNVNSVIRMRKKKVLTRRIYRSIFFRVLFFLILFVLLFTFVFGVATVETNDMYPAIRPGDVILYYRLGDINDTDVVYYSTKNRKNVGRVIASSGEKIGKTSGNELTVQGNIQPIQKDRGLFYKTKVIQDSKITYPLTVQDGTYFILGDKRDTASDSRAYGCIQKGDIAGKVFTVIKRRTI